MSTMPTQKVFKQRVRTRMAKTGESYTAARSQLLRKAADPASASAPAMDQGTTLVSDTAMARATGHDHAYWFAVLDAWGATERTHPEITRWIHATYGLEGWWCQNITVAYERARGLRRTGQMADGFSVTVSRTFAADPATLLAAFTDPAIRDRWYPGAPLTQRPTKAALTRRFDWRQPPSRVVVTLTPKPDGRVVVGVTHEQLEDAATAEEMKVSWRARLGVLRTVIEG